MSTNRLILGTSNLGVVGGRETAFALLDAYFELGGRTIDTANVYSNWVPGEEGRSENIIGEWMATRGNRKALTIITKGAHPPLGHMEIGRCDRASIRHDIEQSLSRLRTDRVDLYYLHRDEPGRPVADIMETLNELVREGKVRALGCSNWSLPRILEARTCPGVTFTANQVLGNALCRLMNPLSDPTNYVLDAAMFHDAVAHDVTLQLYTSQCQGLFEKLARGAAPPHNYANSACTAAAQRIEHIAAVEGTPAGNLIVAYLLGLADNVQPIIGPRNAEQVQYSYAAGAIELRQEVVEAIAAATGMQEFVVAT